MYGETSLENTERHLFTSDPERSEGEESERDSSPIGLRMTKRSRED